MPTIIDLPNASTPDGGEYLVVDVPNGDGTYSSKKVSTAEIATLARAPLGAAADANGGTSVIIMPAGNLEAVFPVQTVAGSSCTFVSTDLFKKTLRSNGGSAMADTFPASTATGMVNGTRITIANVDATASLTITAGAGTLFSLGGSTTSATDVIGPGRDVAYEYDLANTIWRGAFNTRTALLANNNLSEITNQAAARANLGISASGPMTFIGLSSSQTLVAGTQYRILATGLSLALPASPSSGDTIRIVDGGVITPTATCALTTTGATIMGLASPMNIDTTGIDFLIWWNGSDWRLF